VQTKVKWAVLAVAAAGVFAGGTAIAGARGDDDVHDERYDAVEQVTDRAVIERASAVALEAGGGGTVGGVEAADDGRTGCEVELDRADGSSLDVNLDRRFRVVSVAADDD
jgi:hypothetical protein